MKSARVVSSAMTITSLGPAIESMSTSPKTMLLGQRDEQVAGADDLVDPCRRPFDAVGQRRHRLAPRRRDRPPSRPAHGTSPAGPGCTSRTASAARRRRSARRPPPAPARPSSAPSTDTPPPRRGRRRRRAAAADSAARDSRHAPVRAGHVAMQESPAGTCKIRSRIRRTVSRNAGSAAAWAAASSAADTRSSAAVSCLPSSLAVYSSTAASPRCAHVAADPLDHLHRRQRLAKHLDRLPPPRLADDVPLGRQLRPQRGNLRRGVRVASVDAGNVQRHGGEC